MRLGYNEVRDLLRSPSVTIASGPVPRPRPEFRVPNGENYPDPVIDGNLNDAVWANAPSFDIRYGDDALRDTYPNVGPWRSGQYQPQVNGGTAFVFDPGDATVKYFFKGNKLYLGFDVRDQVVQYVPAFDRWDGFDGELNERNDPRAERSRAGRQATVVPGRPRRARRLRRTTCRSCVDTAMAAQVALMLKPDTTRRHARPGHRHGLHGGDC